MKIESKGRERGRKIAEGGEKKTEFDNSSDNHVTQPVAAAVVAPCTATIAETAR